MVTKEELKQALSDLGVSKGMTLEVHSSLSSFGNLEGGAMTLTATLKNLSQKKEVFLCWHNGL